MQTVVHFPLLKIWLVSVSVFLFCPLNLNVCIRNLWIQWVPGVFPRVKVARVWS